MDNEPRRITRSDIAAMTAETKRDREAGNSPEAIQAMNLLFGKVVDTSSGVQAFRSPTREKFEADVQVEFKKMSPDQLDKALKSLQQAYDALEKKFKAKGQVMGIRPIDDVDFQLASLVHFKIREFKFLKTGEDIGPSSL